MTATRDQARFDLLRYHKGLITNRSRVAARIARRYKLTGLSPLEISEGIEAVSHGLDPFDAIEKPMERSE